MNKKKALVIMLLLLLAGGGTFLLFIQRGSFPFFNGPAEGLEARTAEPILDLYRPGAAGRGGWQQASIPVHYTLRWTNPETGQLTKELELLLSKNKEVVLSLELWGTRRKESYRAVLERVLNGKYDNKIEELATMLARHKKPVYLRLNPAMELPQNNFPWQNREPRLYIQFFGYFAQKLKEKAPGVAMLWGPAGYPGALEYWPGSEVVDLVSISLNQPEKSYSAWIQKDSWALALRSRLHRLRFIEEPVMIIGSASLPPKAYKHEMLQTALAELEDGGFSGKTIAGLRSEAVLAPSEETKQGSSEIAIGVYDPEQQLRGMEAVNVEHLFVSLTGVHEGPFQERFQEVLSRGHAIIVTVEPWGQEERKGPQNVLENVLNGTYDKELEALYSLLAEANQDVYLRFAQEMEIPVARYPWQRQDPLLYIKAYRYFANFRNPLPANISLVWGPAGDRGSLEWWPGNDVVDFISIAIYGLPDKNITEYKKQQAFSAIFRRKIHRMRLVDKPVFITEFGVKGPEGFQQTWLKEAAATLNKNAEKVAGICYFNLYDSPNAWGKIQAPDWSISATTFKHFVSSLDEKTCYQQP